MIVTHLGCESVVSLDNHTQWLRRLYVLIFVLLLPIVCGFRGVEDSPLQPPISGGVHGASMEDVHLDR